MTTRQMTLAEQGIIGLSVTDVAREQAVLGRKFVAADVDDDLYDAAVEYARAYKGDFGFMVDMAVAVHRAGELTDNQAKGVLNCMAAEGRWRERNAPVLVETGDQRQPQPKPYVPTSDKYTGGAPDSGIAVNPEVTREPVVDDAVRPDVIENGRYTVVLDGDEDDYVTMLVEDDFRVDGPLGAKVLKYLAGPDNSSDYVGFAFVELKRSTGQWTFVPWKRFLGNGRLWRAATALVEAPEAAGQAYALRSNRCRRCGRALTVPASINAGYGPECAQLVGRGRG